MNTEEIQSIMGQIKLPLGVMPKWQHDRLRYIALQKAIVRYLEAGIEPPMVWAQEAAEIKERIPHLLFDSSET